MRTIYLDNNATTRVDPATVEAMLPFFTEHFGNPSTRSVYGARARAGLAVTTPRATSNDTPRAQARTHSCHRLAIWPQRNSMRRPSPSKRGRLALASELKLMRSASTPTASSSPL